MTDYTQEGLRAKALTCLEKAENPPPSGDRGWESLRWAIMAQTYAALAETAPKTTEVVDLRSRIAELSAERDGDSDD